MLKLIHWLIVLAYLAAPVVAILVSLATRRRHRAMRIMTIVSLAIVFGSAMAFSCALAGNGRISAFQVFLCIYFTGSLIILVGVVDQLMLAVLRRAWRVPKSEGVAARFWRSIVQSLPLLFRAAFLVVLLIPYLIATALTYQPKILPRENPGALGVDFARAEFETSDGLTIRGWWIPASSTRGEFQRAPQPRGLHAFGRDTVVLCHGLGTNKSALLRLAGAMLSQGYNVLMFDFRGHGESDGELTTFGDLERRDVLAAVHWLREQHPRQTERILGLGISTGGAALIEAAGDPSIDGQTIEALAVIEGFDDLPAVAKSAARSRFLAPMSWIVDRATLALASAQTGADLLHFSPASDVKQIWPRPILIIHGSADSVIPFENGQRLYDAALEPRRSFWLLGANQDQTLESASTLREIREFFDDARPVPAI